MSTDPRKWCYLLRIDPSEIEEYVRAHTEIWPEMASALRDSGYGNFSVFVDVSGLVIAYVETEDFDAMVARMGETEVNARWGDYLGHMFRPVDDTRLLDTIAPIRIALDLDASLERITE